jgi:type II secretory pathway pseudopilin PulG
MVCVIACLAIVASLVGWIAKDAVAARRETKLRMQLHQTDRLLDAGILRSSLQTRRDGDYGGETWKPKLQVTGQDANASVEISVDDGQTTVTAKIGFHPNITSKSYVYSSSKVQ